MNGLFEPLTFLRGQAMKNRLMLAPMTNLQSNTDGTLSDEEYRWLVMRAEAGYGLTMTCAASVEAGGQGFPGNLGVYSDRHTVGLARLAKGIKQAGSVAALQLYHAGSRSKQDLTGHPPLSPSGREQGAGTRAMTTDEVETMIESFVEAALRAEAAGFDGVEIHGAHGYLLSAFLSPELNVRDDQFGGTLENRARPLLAVLEGIRRRCGPDFNLGLRLSSERFGLRLMEMRDLAQQIMTQGSIDYLDVSLWDVFKEPAEEEFQGRSLMSYFTELERGNVRLGVAGKIMSAADATFCLDAGADFVLIGRGAILHYDFPQLARADSAFVARPLPVTRAHLVLQGLAPVFIDYLNEWPGFIDG